MLEMKVIIPNHNFLKINNKVFGFTPLLKYNIHIFTKHTKNIQINTFMVVCYKFIKKKIKNTSSLINVNFSWYIL